MWARLAFSAAAVMTLAGCASGAAGTAAGAPAPATGRAEAAGRLAAVAAEYTLVAIDGHALPYSPKADNDPGVAPTKVVGGTLTVRANGTFLMSTQYSATEAQGERRFDGQFSGSCAPQDEGFRMFWDGGGETPLTVKGDTVIVNNNGVRFHYLRQTR